MHFEEIIQRLNTEATSERDKGYKFELLIKNWLLYEKLYRENIDKIYLWSEFPLKKQFGSGQDIGIDIVATTKNGEYWAIQCKCYDEGTLVSKEDVAKFVAASNRLFSKEPQNPNRKSIFDQRFFIASTNNWTDHAVNEAHQQQNRIITITKTELENSNIDWLELYNQVILNTPQRDPNIPLKTIRPYQKEALEAVHKHLLTHDRGKLIMACGTGKTFTSLKIAEQETNGKGFVLFLVPSIALLGQTLREWKYQYDGVFKAVCVCSDEKVSKKTKKDEDTNVESVEDLAYPASTDPHEIARQIAEGRNSGHFTVIFSTYQSIEAVKLALDTYYSNYGVNFGSSRSCGNDSEQLISPNGDKAFTPTPLRSNSVNYLIPTSATGENSASTTASIMNNTQEPQDGRGAAGELDLIICDEAHRTTGYADSEETRSAFTKVHDNDFIRAKKRIYMTATPRIYSAQAKNKVREQNAKGKDESILCSMDDVEMYGEEMFRLNFSRAVKEKLLTDYKVFILSTSQNALDEDINFDDLKDLKKPNVDDLGLKSRIMGSISALSKLMMDTDKSVTNADPNPMKRAVAFCGTIALSKYAQKTYDIIKDYLYKKQNKDNGNQAKKILPLAKHIDGSMSALQREQLLDGLKSEPEEGYCNILTNAKCLSEGVDVPSLDAVIFLSPKKSKADIVQSVGRVMRLAPNKKYGYIIIPICCDGYKTANEAIEKSDEFDMVWEVLNALRSHDDRIQSEVNLIKAGGRSNVINIVDTSEVEEVHEGEEDGGYRTDNSPDLPLPKKSIQTSFKFRDLEGEFFAKLVEKVGRRNYIENWAKEVADLALKEHQHLKDVISKTLKNQKVFDDFMKSLHDNVNPTITRDQAIEMLTQQLITKPIFEAIFGKFNEQDGRDNEDNKNKEDSRNTQESQVKDFVANNVISKDLQKVIKKLEEDEPDKIYKQLQEFYDTIKDDVSHVTRPDSQLSPAKKKIERQNIIKDLYGKFFKTAFPRVQEQLGIVYTPIEAVDFMINSVDDILKEEFGKSLADEGIKILDPFTGTGTFITRLIEKISILSRKNKDVLRRKFTEELNANEIILLAYYIAGINIEQTYQDLTGEYLPFKKLCLQDTFLSYEAEYSEENELPSMSESFFENAENAQLQRKDNITVIIGNPPYSIGQKSANDNAQNQSYPKLDEKIQNTYAKESKGNNPKSLYDSYIKAFRYATDRIKYKGIICFITNGDWLESASTDGFRKCLENEFDKIYIYNLRGNQGTKGKGELGKKEGGKIFGSGSRTTIAIVLLIKNGKNEECKIKYCDIGDYLSREEKLAKIAEAKSFKSLDLIEIKSDKDGFWFNKRDESFDELIPIYPNTKFDSKSKSFFTTFSCGYVTNQDSLFYNFSKDRLHKYFSEALDFYNSERERYQNSDKKISVEDFVNKDNNKLSLNSKVLGKIKSNEKIFLEDSIMRESLYRPFCSQNLRDEKKIIFILYQMPTVFPKDDLQNFIIYMSGAGTINNFSCLISDKIIDLNFIHHGQGFPLYWYEKQEKRQGELDLFADNAEQTQEQYIRRDGISDWILKRAKELYSPQISNESGNIEPLSLRGSLRPWQSNGFVNTGNLNNQVTKEDIFYYVYGFLHLESYRKKFANNLKNELPKIPLVEDYATFEKISKAGRELAELHLNFEPEANVENELRSSNRVNTLTSDLRSAHDSVRCIDSASASLGDSAVRPAGTVEDEYEKYEISKVRQSDDKTKLFFYKKNGDIFEEETLDIPPEVEKWQINGSTCTWWIEKMYKVTTDPKTGRINDPNDYAREYGNPRYIFELAKNVINIAIKTVAILDELNKLQVEI